MRPAAGCDRRDHGGQRRPGGSARRSGGAIGVRQVDLGDDKRVTDARMIGNPDKLGGLAALGGRGTPADESAGRCPSDEVRPPSGTCRTGSPGGSEDEAVDSVLDRQLRELVGPLNDRPDPAPRVGDAGRAPPFRGSAVVASSHERSRSRRASSSISFGPSGPLGTVRTLRVGQIVVVICNWCSADDDRPPRGHPQTRLCDHAARRMVARAGGAAGRHPGRGGGGSCTRAPPRSRYTRVRSTRR